MADSDWNTLFKSNCQLPSRKSIHWASENKRKYVRFTLTDGDKGGCSTDAVARHSAPYWERAELKQVGTLERNTSYSIDATLRFVEGFGGSRETFFQTHAYNASCKQAYPPIMIKFDNTYSHHAVLTVRALQSNRRHNSYRTDIRIDDILGDWVDLTLKLDTREDASATLLLDGEPLISDVPFWIEPCGILHIKFGAYRPGNLSGTVKSIVDFDSVNVY